MPGTQTLSAVLALEKAKKPVHALYLSAGHCLCLTTAALRWATLGSAVSWPLHQCNPEAPVPHLHAGHHGHPGRLADDGHLAGQARVLRLPLGAACGAAGEVLLRRWRLAAVEPRRLREGRRQSLSVMECSGHRLLGMHARGLTSCIHAGWPLLKQPQARMGCPYLLLKLASCVRGAATSG